MLYFYYVIAALSVPVFCVSISRCCRMLCGNCHKYTMGCPPVRGDNPRAVASGLYYVQVGNHDITNINTTYINVGLAHHEIFRAKVGKVGII